MIRALALLLTLGCCFTAAAEEPESDWSVAGHLKLRSNLFSYPDDSAFRDLLGASALDLGAEGRFKFAWRASGWDVQVDYQLIGIRADTLILSEGLPGGLFPSNRVINDDRRWFDLSWTLADSDHGALVHRFDRASAGYASDRWVWRFGRQAVSWGNGLLFNPMDIFNPFDPAAVDTEYKTGDDMLYGQYLFAGGNDLQGVAVVRRDPLTGDVEQDQSSLAFKFHGFAGSDEFDLLLAEHYDDLVIGAGGSMALGGAILRGDMTWTRTPRDDLFSAVANLSYSWVLGGKNVSGVLEYFFNGFGQTGGDYATEDLLRNPDLLRRLERGELYTLSRNYLAASATIEMTPLFQLTPVLFVNLEDPSSLLQMVARYDWKQDLQLLGAVNLPVGAPGTEYGGIETPTDGRYYSTGPSLFAQLAWYF